VPPEAPTCASAAGALKPPTASAAAPLHEARPLMGTLVEVSVEPPAGGEAHAHAAIDAAYREMARLSDMMNHYDPNSVVSAINDAAGLRAVPAPPELMAVLAMAQAMSAKSDGAFDITVASLRGWRFRADDPRVPSAAEIAAQLPRVNWRNLRIDAQALHAYGATITYDLPLARTTAGTIEDIRRHVEEEVPRALEAAVN